MVPESLMASVNMESREALYESAFPLYCFYDFLSSDMYARGT